MNRVDQPFQPFDDPRVASVFEAYPENVRAKLLALRRLIFETAAANPAVGPIEETLKWGEPAYLTSQSKSGSTIRLDWKEKLQRYGLFFICHTNLVAHFRDVFGEGLPCVDNRAILFEGQADFPDQEIRYCIESALTYHLNRKPGK
ncbi:MAG TPA: DUF1801 domain-containing protein [Calditrichia bacterium]|nr:DUF1801 domain-containing protein [Calditrichota bacterium]HQU74407.1 DUF1801 domain-containing protein [Calditrichia bacterium]HQV32017.1 DUF1801 domain-containing protein [Calditrichia bacterium]